MEKEKLLAKGKLPKEEYLEKSVSGPLAHGMLMCITKRLLRKAMPFPESNGFHDQWIMFCALCEDSCYYLNEQLVSYRKHGNNATGKSKYAGNLFQQLKAILRMFMHTTKSTDRVVLGEKMMNHLKEYGSDVTSAYETAKEVYEIGLREMDAFTDSRIRGAFKLTRLYCSNMRYRRSGTKVVILKLFAILFKN